MNKNGMNKMQEENGRLRQINECFLFLSLFYIDFFFILTGYLTTIVLFIKKIEQSKHLILFTVIFPWVLFYLSIFFFLIDQHCQSNGCHLNAFGSDSNIIVHSFCYRDFWNRQSSIIFCNFKNSLAFPTTKKRICFIYINFFVCFLFNNFHTLIIYVAHANLAMTKKFRATIQTNGSEFISILVVVL